jgi:hypothetical protein
MVTVDASAELREKNLRLNWRYSIYVSLWEDFGERMRRVWKYRVVVVFLLLAVLVGGTAAISVAVMEITFALVLAFIVGILAVLIVISRLKKRRK